MSTSRSSSFFGNSSSTAPVPAAPAAPAPRAPAPASNSFFGTSKTSMQAPSGSSEPGFGSKLWVSFKEKVSSATSSVPVLVFITLLVITGVIIFLIYKVRQYSLKTVDLMRVPVINANPMSGEHHTFLGGRLPELRNGGEYTFSLWLYMENVTITSDYKIVLYQGNASGYVNGSTFVYMDPNTNRLYITLRTNGNPEVVDRDGRVMLQQIKDNPNLMQATIDYVPMQRWVHVMFSVRDAVMYLYLDGELYSVNSVYDLPTRADGSRPMITKPIGDVFIGGKADREGVNGYLARAQFMNFAATLQQAKAVYNEGPYKRSLLSYVGIDNVNIRSPFYFTDPDIEAKDKCDNNQTL